jgi:tetratricopeptide (TPR) repeat protein
MTPAPETPAAPAVADIGIGRSLERIRLAVSMGKWATARALLDAARAEAPEHPEILGLWGWVLARTGGDLEAAHAACRRALEAQPYVAHHHGRLGEVYRALGLAPQAATCYAAALRLDPDEPLSRAALAPAAPPRRPRLRAWIGRALARRSRPRPT